MRHHTLLYSFIQKISKANELELTFAGKIGSLLETHAYQFGIIKGSFILGGKNLQNAVYMTRNGV